MEDIIDLLDLTIDDDLFAMRDHDVKGYSEGVMSAIEKNWRATVDGINSATVREGLKTLVNLGWAHGGPVASLAKSLPSTGRLCVFTQIKWTMIAPSGASRSAGLGSGACMTTTTMRKRFC